MALRRAVAEIADGVLYVNGTAAYSAEESVAFADAAPLFFLPGMSSAMAISGNELSQARSRFASLCPCLAHSLQASPAALIAKCLLQSSVILNGSNSAII